MITCNASKEAISIRICAINPKQYSQRYRDYSDKDYDSTCASQRLRFVGTPVSLTHSLPSVSVDVTKVALERSTSKMT
jgi:hypothetical protein